VSHLLLPLDHAEITSVSHGVAIVFSKTSGLSSLALTDRLEAIVDK
jgi:hypothetical protein